MLKKLFSINIAVKDLEAAMATYETLLGIKPSLSKPGDFAFPGLKGASFNFNGVLFNLIASDNDETTVSKFIGTKGEGIMLISLESDNVARDVEKFRAEGLKFAMDKNWEGATGKVNFIHPKSMHGVQVELIEPSLEFRSRL